MKTFVEVSEFEKALTEGWKIVDVRAPIEFSVGELSHSVNLPILDNSEREKVGTCYKQQGREKAIRLGHELLNSEKKSERVSGWQSALADSNSMITCFRGGLRSQYAQEWLREAGLERPRLKGGYKALRSFLLSKFNEILTERALVIVTGTTGSGKTICLRDVEPHRPVLDMERIGRHRGSAFGAYDDEQPAQATYENRLATELIQINHRFPAGSLILEDESRMLGRLVNPEILFERLRASPVVLIEEPIQERVEIIFSDYIEAAGLTDSERQGRTADRYRKAMQAISKRLGGLRYDECRQDFENALVRQMQGLGADDHRVWIEKLLNWYYDPLYRKSLDSRQPTILFRGSRREVRDFLLSRPEQSHRECRNYHQSLGGAEVPRRGDEGLEAAQEKS